MGSLIAYVSFQFVLAIMLLCIGGTIAGGIPAYRMLFEIHYGQNIDLYCHVMYYGGIADGTYGGLSLSHLQSSLLFGHRSAGTNKIREITPITSSFSCA
jgi:hypothetical protein